LVWETAGAPSGMGEVLSAFKWKLWGAKGGKWGHNAKVPYQNLELKVFRRKQLQQGNVEGTVTKEKLGGG